MKVTRELIRAGQLLRLEILDHIILGLRLPRKKERDSPLSLW
ncbi:MAG: JAB domain-containing protein [Gammaproteobacteria bacterium]|nr:JAB domain-containing protein [Gammaproteobacteria bacterium]